MTDEREIILEAIKNGATSVPAIRRSTGLSYQVLYPALERLTPWEISRQVTPDGWDRFYPTGAAPGDEDALEPFCVQCRRKCSLDSYRLGCWRCSHCSISFPGSKSRSKPKPKKQVKPMAHIESEQLEADRVLADMRERGTHPPVQLGEDEEKAIETTRDEDETLALDKVETPAVPESDLCKCGKLLRHKGRCTGSGFPKEASEQAVLKKRAASNGQKPEKYIAKNITTDPARPAKAKKASKKPAELLSPAPVTQMFKLEYGKISIYCETPEDSVTLASLLQPHMPKNIKRAWTREMESDDGEWGSVGMTYLYLVSMLHYGMEPFEQQAVWTLIMYLKRMQAIAEEK